MIGEILSVAKTLVTGLNVAVQALSVVAKVVVGIGKALGIIKDKEIDEEDLGDKALQAEEAGIVPEDFDTYEEYLEEIENFEVDPEKSKKYTQAEKLAKAMELTVTGAVEEYGKEVMPLIYAIGINPEFFTIERVVEYMKGVECGEISGSDVTDYLKGNIKNFEKADEVLDFMVKVEQKLDPSKSETDAENLFDKIKID